MLQDVIKTTVEELLEALGIRVETIVVSDGTRTVVSVSAPQASELIGSSGEVLQALNIVARRLIEARLRAAHTENTDPPAAFLIDINGYHKAKLEELRTQAREGAERAKLFKHEVELPPMTSYERLVVHELFANDLEIETASAGEGKFRHVVLKYKQTL